MLPLVVDEKKIFIFKFWFNGSIQDGMSYQNELFCRLQTFDIQHRAQVYHFACKLTQQNTALVITSSAKACSLWASLRDPLTTFALTEPETFTLTHFKVPPIGDS